jgi:hypothetical protein
LGAQCPVFVTLQIKTNYKGSVDSDGDRFVDRKFCIIAAEMKDKNRMMNAFLALQTDTHNTTMTKTSEMAVSTFSDQFSQWTGALNGLVGCWFGIWTFYRPRKPKKTCDKCKPCPCTLKDNFRQEG